MTDNWVQNVPSSSYEGWTEALSRREFVIVVGAATVAFPRWPCPTPTPTPQALPSETSVVKFKNSRCQMRWQVYELLKDQSRITTDP